MIKNIVIVLVLVFCLSIKLHAQDFTFSQFYESPLLRNPALAGVYEGDLRINGTFRNQWQSITVPYKTEALSVEAKFPVGNKYNWISGGLQITHDVAGDIQLKKTQLLPVINYHQCIDEPTNSYLSIAAMFGPVQTQFDPTQLKLGDQFDTQTGTYNPNITSQQKYNRTGFTYWDYSMGLSWSSSFEMSNGNIAKYYVGGGLFHINRPSVGFFTTDDNGTKLNRKYVANAGLTLPVSDIHKLVFYGDYFFQGGNRQFLGGVLYGIDAFHDYQPANENLYNDITIYAGAFYRWKDALIPVVKLDIFAFTVGLSYDATISQLKTASQVRGGFELTLTYRAKLNNNRTGEYGSSYGSRGNDRSSRHQTQCPSF